MSIGKIFHIFGIRTHELSVSAKLAGYRSNIHVSVVYKYVLNCICNLSNIFKDESRKYSEESEKRAQRLRQLLETAEAERRSLAAKLEEERR